MRSRINLCMPAKKKGTAKAVAKEVVKELTSQKGSRKRRRRKGRPTTQPRPSKGDRASKLVPSKDLARVSKRNMLAAVIALPGEHNCQFPTEGGEATDIRALKMLLNLSSPANPNIAKGFVNGELLIAFFGQPGRALLYWRDPIQTTYSGYFQTMSASGVATMGATLQVVDGATILIDSLNLSYSPGLSLPLIGFNSSNGGFHGLWLPAAVYGPVDGGLVFMNQGDQLTIVIKVQFSAGTTSVEGEALFSLRTFVRPGQDLSLTQGQTARVRINGVPPVSTSVTFTCQATGYYSVEFCDITMITVGGGQMIDFTINGVILLAGTNAGWSNVSMPELYSPTMAGASEGGVPQFGYSARVNGASLLCTNVTSALNRGGMVRAARFESTGQFYQRTSTEMNATSNDMYNGDASLGVYTFRESTSASSRYVRHASPMGPLIDLDFCDRYSMLCLAPPGVTNTFAVTICENIEFILSSQTLCTRKACLGGTVEDLRQARVTINSVPCWFFENPMHLRDVYGWIKRAGSALYNNSGRVLGAASVLAPQYSVPLAALSSLFSALKAQ